MSAEAEISQEVRLAIEAESRQSYRLFVLRRKKCPCIATKMPDGHSGELLQIDVLAFFSMALDVGKAFNDVFVVVVDGQDLGVMLFGGRVVSRTLGE